MPISSVAAGRSPSPRSEPRLSQGSRGEAVKRLQAALAERGFDPGPVDGWLGPVTARALRAFQSARGLTVDGVCGPKTWAALGSAPAAERRASPVLKAGAEGPAVAEMQRLLSARGHSPGSVDGVLGPRTRAALVSFQEANGLSRDGVCGPQTWGVLRGGPMPAPAPETVGPVEGNLPRTGNAFIDRVAQGAVEAARRYGIPASVSIAQAILESGWGKSTLAQKANNLFGMKGTGTAGSHSIRTQEYVSGRYVWATASFKKFRTQAESIVEHARLLGTSSYYARARAVSNDPRAFARALTGVYATAPDYDQVLIRLMDQFNLYRFDRA